MDGFGITEMCSALGMLSASKNGVGLGYEAHIDQDIDNDTVPKTSV